MAGPRTNAQGKLAPEVGLIAKYNKSNGRWLDTLGRNWNNAVRFRLPDKDVFAINADTLSQSAFYTGVGTTLFNMVTNPATGKLYVSNSDAQNMTRFEGPGVKGGSTGLSNTGLDRFEKGRQVQGADELPQTANRMIGRYQLIDRLAPQNDLITRRIAKPDGGTLTHEKLPSQRCG